MKAAFFSSVHYLGDAPSGWPVPTQSYSSDIAIHSMETALEQFALADELGYDWVTVAEHHFAPWSLTPNPMVLAGALTQVVKKAKIALLGPDIPILNPIRVAEEFAMLDTMTNGRVIAGMLRGTPNEYVTYNVNPNESRGRFAEALELIKTTWTEPVPFGWQGRHYQFRTVSIWPRPVQSPHPPIYMSGSSLESVELAASQRVSLGFAVTPLDQACRAAKAYRELAPRLGWTPQSEDILYRLSFHVADSDDAAVADLLENRPGQQRRGGLAQSNPAIEAALRESDYFGRNAAEQDARRALSLAGGAQFQRRVDVGQLLVGSAETVFRQILRIHETLAPGVIDLVPATQIGDRTTRSIELFATKVLPRLHNLDPVPAGRVKELS